MKIAVVSPNPQHLRDIARQLEGGSHEILPFDGGKSRMREIAEQHGPDLMLVDGICHDVGELTQVEQLTSRHPSLAVFLLCPSHTPDFLIQAMRAGVREVLPSPAPREVLGAAVERLAAKRRAQASRQARVLAFMSCKGGSGATFVATSIACLLAETHNVLLVDLNLQFGDALGFVHDGRPPANIAELARDVRRLDASLLAASTVKLTPRCAVLAAPDDVAQAGDVRPEAIAAILQLAACEYDFVVLDMPRSLEPVTVAALDLAWRVFVVMQAGLPDLRQAARLLAAFRGLGYPDDKAELILNRHDKSDDISLDHVRRAVGKPRIHTIPNGWRDVHACINHGEPISRRARGSGVARQLNELARAINPRQDDNRGLLGRIFRRA